MRHNEIFGSTLVLVLGAIAACGGGDEESGGTGGDDGAAGSGEP